MYIYIRKYMFQRGKKLQNNSSDVLAQKMRIRMCVDNITL